MADGPITNGPARWLAPFFIVLLTVTAFLPALQNGFVDWDDNESLTENPRYRGLGWAELRWMFTTFHMGHYQPLSWMSFGLDYLLWGMEPFGYHLTSLLLHAANAVFFYFLALRLLSLVLGSGVAGENALRVAAGFVALVFAIHPLRVESVAWATERRDVLAGLFFFLTILCYLRATMTAEGNSARARWMTAAVSVYGLSLLSKAVGMTLPAVLLVLDVYPLGRLGGEKGRWFGPTSRQVWLEKIPFFLLAGAFAIIGLVAQREAGALKALERYDILSRLAQALFGIAFYLWKTIIPVSLSPLYEIPVQMRPWDWPYLLSAIMVLGVSVGLFMIRRQWPAGLAIWISYVAILAPVLGIAQSGPQLVADRYSYFSCLGWAMLAGAGLLYSLRIWANSYVRQGVIVVTAAVVAAFSALTWKQAQVWHDSERLWRQVLAVDQHSSLGHNNLGIVLAGRGERDKAIQHYRQALQIAPGYVYAHYNLGNALAGRGELGEAVQHFREAIRLDPSYAKAHNNLGIALARRGELEEASRYFRRALQIDPAYANAHHNLGNALAGRGELGEAIVHYRQALLFQPEFAEGHESLGRALALTGKRDEAVRHYQEALRIMKSRRETPAPR